MAYSKKLLISILFISGCSSTATVTPPSTSSTSAIDFTKTFIGNTQASGDKFLNKLISGTSTIDRMTGKSKKINDGNGELIKNSEYSKYSAGWVISTRSKVPSLNDLYSGICSKKGGNFKKNVCLKTGSNKVLFFANKSKQGYKTYLTVIEPTKSPLSPAYLKAIHSSGYRTTFDLAQEKAQQDLDSAILAISRKNKLKQELARQDLERPLIRKIGSKICKVHDRINYIGYVERITDVKVQIRISHAHYITSYSSRPGGFKESIIWDNPNNWHICK